MALSMSIKFLGPYTLTGKDSLFKSPIVHSNGIYLTTISWEKSFLTHYVGETGRDFWTRFVEHTQHNLSGNYESYIPEKFAKGKIEYLWGSRNAKDQRERIEEIFEQFPEKAVKVFEYLKTYRYFLGELTFSNDEKSNSKRNTRLRRRMEGAIVKTLKENDEVKEFHFKKGNYTSRKEGEEEIKLSISGNDKIIGLPNEIIC